MDKEFKKTLQDNVYKKLEAMYPEDSDAKLPLVLSKISANATIITLEEYEKLKTEQNQ